MVLQDVVTDNTEIVVKYATDNLENDVKHASFSYTYHNNNYLQLKTELVKVGLQLTAL